MLDFFAIFSKGGIVLWYFQGTTDFFASSVNALIRSVILQERGGGDVFTHGNLALQHKLDNEFELVFVVGYQKVLKLAYIDKLLTDIQLEFRDKYRSDLQLANISHGFDFTPVFKTILFQTEEASRQELLKPRKMKTFDESQKSKKTVASMIESRKDDPKTKSKHKKVEKAPTQPPVQPTPVVKKSPSLPNGEIDPEEIKRNRMKFLSKMEKNVAPKSNKSPAASDKPKKKGKKSTVWEHSGSVKDAKNLDFSNAADQMSNGTDNITIDEVDMSVIGRAKGDLPDMEEESSGEEYETEDLDTVKRTATTASGGTGFGVFSMFRNLVSSKTLSDKDIQPVLEKMKDHLATKNVAMEIAEKLCDSVAAKLRGRVIGTFSGVTSTVKQTLQESCVQILSPKRRIDILRDAMDIKTKLKRPYVVTFCGVNGVGKSTNLAKVAFWLIENGLRVLIAACDTFRAGAVEQLRTHERKLNALHPPELHNGTPMVWLFERGYGKDSAGIAMEAINFARDSQFDVVLIDTAGRMQDNEPLMRALTKLIKVNQPDLVLFVGEALVGNEAVDQLVKFNQALADHSNIDQPRLIDGIILTKFDTIDDKVGAAISMAYITGQPIVFVGTGQTYTDLKNLNAKAVVTALLK